MQNQWPQIQVQNDSSASMMAHPPYRYAHHGDTSPAAICSGVTMASGLRTPLAADGFADLINSP